MTRPFSEGEIVARMRRIERKVQGTARKGD
jgi:hypothetical protein